MSRFSAALAAALIAVAAGLAARPGAASSVQTAPGLIAEVVVTDVARPIQLAFDRGGRLVVLSHGRRGDAAGEIHRLDVTQALPIDAGRAPRVVIPFSEAPRKPTLGSLAVDPRTGDLYLGEENGNRVYHLETHSRLTAVAVGLQHLVGGSSIALDGDGRLVAVDYASPETQGRAEVPPPPGLDVLGTGYQGPLIFRVTLGDGAALPRRLDLVPPFFPRWWISPPGGAVTTVASELGDPGGVAVDDEGRIYIAETALHRVIRISPARAQ